MRKLQPFVLLFFVLFFVMSCGPKPPMDVQEVPEWWLNPPVAEDAFYEVGDAVKRQMALAKEAAEGRARAAIAKTCEVKVQTMFRDFMQESGIGENSRALEFTETVTKQVSNQVLKGSKIIKREVKPDGSGYHVFALCEYPLQSLIDATLSEAKNEEALYNEFKAEQGFERLEEAIKSMDTSK